MADFIMPALGADMEEGTLVEWMVKPGDQVKSGDVVAVIETVKGAIETEIFENGTVGELRVKVGETVPVGTVLATILGNEEEKAEAAASAPATPVHAAPETAPKPQVPVAPKAPAGAVRASPAARKLAMEAGVDLARLKGTGPGGAVTLADVQAAAGASSVAEPPSAPKRGFDPEAMRRGIAAAMAKSKREIPHYYLSTQIDMTRALQWLSAANAKRKIGDRLLQLVLPLKALALALREVPELNGFYSEGAFQPNEQIHIGVAIALRGGGLVAPALHDVDKKSLDELMRDLNDLITRARTGMLRSSEMTDPTVTLTNMGDTGVEGIFGIVYPPQVAIVGLGRVVERPWVVEGTLEPRPIMLASLSADHRASDGHRGGIFLNTFDKLLQKPEAL
ncbi:acetyltransferase component of pyruvate dehydrogenase complex [Marinobacterium zhoushanense]|uniref:Dihydrolipoamide acetyltransferase component of pyruvate dehydrogenase complex n=1 Tax=Marinobacterium zhoushanense TaxID=1679163 RepID=A0ABQ1KDX5_9GAMM|nr:dihydrolipoamide acetyltransferase family protein [Marinobacterium zhoushanense]GGB91247.1 acetyltransferase component of pyruvate dehydrogenase complex [Marinobacterium zhoushanense]